MFTVTPLVQKGELLIEKNVYENASRDEYPTTIPKGFIGTVLGVTNSDCYIFYCGKEYDEVFLVDKKDIRLLDAMKEEESTVITWYYNEFGQVAIWKGVVESPENNVQADIYLQVDEEVASFFDQIGYKTQQVNIGDWDTIEDIGYFN